MANPQVDDGYVRIANELLEAIYRANLTMRQLRIIFCIIRNTYGYNRKETELSLSDIATDTGISRSKVCETVKELERKNIVIVNGGSLTKPRMIGLQKDYEKWVEVFPKRELFPKREQMCSQNGNSRCSQNGNTTYKDNIKDNIKTNNAFSDCETKPKKKKATGELPEWFEEVWKLYPEKKGKNAISKKSYKPLRDAGRDTIVKAIEAYKLDLQHNPWKHAMNGSTFFNGRWMDYTGENANQYSVRDYSVSIEQLIAEEFEEIEREKREKGNDPGNNDDGLGGW